MTARWRKQKNETGLARVCQGPRGFELWDDGVCVMHVSPLTAWPGREISGWYWYGMGMNTARNPLSTSDEAKTAAMAHYKQAKKD